MSVTIAPPPCGRAVYGRACGDVLDGHTIRCPLCTELGHQLMDVGATYYTDARDFETRWSRSFGVLCWNLAIAALLGCAAESRR